MPITLKSKKKPRSHRTACERGFFLSCSNDNYPACGVVVAGNAAGAEVTDTVTVAACAAAAVDSAGSAFLF